MKGRRGRTRAAGLAAGLALALGCAGRSVLPGDEVSDSPFRSYARARDAFAAIEPGRTTAADLAGLSIDPARQAVVVRPYTDVVALLFPHEGMLRGDHPAPVAACLDARLRCRVWLLDVERIKNRRRGAWLKEILQLRREERTEGFLFTGILLLIDDRVEFKLAAGVPSMGIRRETLQPLGFVQGRPDAAPRLRLGVPPIAGRVRAATAGRRVPTLKGLRAEEARGASKFPFEEEGP